MDADALSPKALLNLTEQCPYDIQKEMSSPRTVRANIERYGIAITCIDKGDKDSVIVAMANPFSGRNGKNLRNKRVYSLSLKDFDRLVQWDNPFRFHPVITDASVQRFYALWALYGNSTLQPPTRPTWEEQRRLPRPQPRTRHSERLARQNQRLVRLLHQPDPFPMIVGQLASMSFPCQKHEPVPSGIAYLNSNPKEWGRR